MLGESSRKQKSKNEQRLAVLSWILSKAGVFNTEAINPLVYTVCVQEKV